MSIHAMQNDEGSDWRTGITESEVASCAAEAEETLRYCLRLLETDGDEHDRRRIKVLLHAIQKRRELALRATALRASRRVA